MWSGYMCGHGPEQECVNAILLAIPEGCVTAILLAIPEECVTAHALWSCLFSLCAVQIEK